MFTTKFRRVNGWIKTVNGRKAPDHLLKLRIPPAWTDVKVNPDPRSPVMAMGTDAAGRLQRLYSVEHVAKSKSVKFERVRELLTEWSDIKTQIESALNDPETTNKDYEAYLVAYLIYETGIRPGSSVDTKAEQQAFGATTLQLRHVKPCANGNIRLKFVGKKGVQQSILVTNPYLVGELLERKNETTSYTTLLFDVSSTKLREVFKRLGSGKYSPKDFRTALGTSIALNILSHRKRWPNTKKGRKAVVNQALDRVAKQLGNTRSISRSSYVDPSVLDEFVPDNTL